MFESQDRKTCVFDSRVDGDGEHAGVYLMLSLYGSNKLERQGWTDSVRYYEPSRESGRILQDSDGWKEATHSTHYGHEARSATWLLEYNDF